MANPYRDKRGRFTSAGRAIMWIGGGAAVGAGLMAGGGAGTGALLGALSGTAGLAQAKLLNTAGDAAGRGIERLAYGSPRAKAIRSVGKTLKQGNSLKPISKKESARLKKKFKI